MRKILFIVFFFGVVVSSLGQVNLQTGSAVFSLPMFSWQDNQSRLHSNVALGYSSGNGLTVNDIASNIGQGWNLAAGGVITRLQVGQPDDQYPHNTSSDNDISRYPGGYLYATHPADLGCPLALTKYPIYKSMNQLYTPQNTTVEDKTMDYFTFQFNGKAGMFALDTLPGDVGITLGTSHLKISFQRDLSLLSQNIRTTITSFTIQDEDGLIYKFANHGLTQVLAESFCNPDHAVPLTQPKFGSNNLYFKTGFVNTKLGSQYIIGSWYLSEVDDPFTNRKILYNYNPTPNTLNNFGAPGITYNQNGNYSVINTAHSISITPELDGITYPDGHDVVFNYGAPRVDLNGQKVLSSVDISYLGRYISEYQFNTTYFILNRYGTPSTAYEKSMARLCLKSVKKIGVDLKEDSPPYQFDYYLGSGGDDVVPPPFSLAKDVWGFYNGNNNIDYSGNPISYSVTISQMNNSKAMGLCFMNSASPGTIVLNPKTGYAKNGLLRQIVYPTGGSLSYQYDQNRGVLTAGGTEVAVGGVHVTQTSSSDGGYSNGCGNPIVTQYSYITDETSNLSSLWGLEMPQNSITTGSHYASEERKWHISWDCPVIGCCYWNYAYPGILSQLQAISLSDFQNFMEAIAPVLGVLTIVTDAMDIATVVGGSTVVLAWVAVIVDIAGAIFQFGITCFSGDNAKDETTTIYYNSDLNGGSPLPAQYKRVEITESPGTAGKTVQVFTSSDDYPAFVWTGAGQNTMYTSKQRFASWAYGLPESTTVYDVSGNKVKETLNLYNITATPIAWNLKLGESQSLEGTYGLLVNCNCQVEYSRSQRNTDWSNPSIYDVTATNIMDKTSSTDLRADFYGMMTGLAELTQTTETVYRQNDPSHFVRTVTSYTYDSRNNEISTIATTLSNGDLVTKSINYTVDFPSTTNAPLLALVQSNIVTLPVSTSTVVSKAGSGAGGLLNEKVTEFTQLADGSVKPSRVLEQRFAQPSASFTTYSPDNAGNSSIYKVTQTLAYNASDDLVGLKDEGGRSVANIYDYYDKYVVASVINADPVLDFPAYTSFETTSLGGWTLAGAPTYVLTSAITGTVSFNLTGDTLSAPLNTAKPYTLSFWASSSSVTVSSGATQTKSAPTYNGFTYYEYDIAQGVSTVSLTGSANIDELRLYPKAARMQTTAYDPLVGKISESDQNNRITYYEYDNLGRLRFVKDENHNAVKMYEYNNVSSAKQNGCPGTYYNNLITETFTRSNCGSTFLGGDVTFTEPANKYSSVYSQSDADMQAEMDLMTNGQAYADANGSCTLLYYNAAQSQTIYSQNCPDGMVPGAMTYTVPANRYSSVISQADADQQAADEIYANAQAYANDPLNAVCNISTVPVWVTDPGAVPQCETQGTPATNTGYQTVIAKDQNPNSASYGQTQYIRIAMNTTSCPMPCYLTDANKWTSNSVSIVASGPTVTFSMVSYEEGIFSFTSPTKIGTYTNAAGGSEGCLPSATRSATVTESGRTWTVTVDTSGNIYIQLVSGTAPPAGTSGSSLIYLSFSISL
ncbi:MAG: DUF5977 domain-containing protein [Puia sp.]|nr:DUF5977 domain-containing protein [Puia sp.]